MHFIENSKIFKNLSPEWCTDSLVILAQVRVQLRKVPVRVNYIWGECQLRAIFINTTVENGSLSTIYFR